MVRAGHRRRLSRRHAAGRAARRHAPVGRTAGAGLVRGGVRPGAAGRHPRDAGRDVFQRRALRPLPAHQLRHPAFRADRARARHARRDRAAAGSLTAAVARTGPSRRFATTLPFCRRLAYPSALACRRLPGWSPAAPIASVAHGRRAPSQQEQGEWP
ncbi:hypothetical protein CBM2585_A60204 [Cupriavidus taiwanensis]|nr:hypothetical protein CBM2585_A60204 [Cupriavidus taiwanensis]